MELFGELFGGLLLFLLLNPILLFVLIGGGLMYFSRHMKEKYPEDSSVNSGKNDMTAKKETEEVNDASLAAQSDTSK